MNESALSRRRRRRRVADDKRKRAPRACDRCKARKSRCIESTPGRCLRCLQKDLSCKFEREVSPGEDMLSNATPVQNGATPTPGADDNISINSHQADRIMWPRFLSRLREAFSLDLQTTPEAHDMMAMQAHITGPRSLQPAETHRLRRAIDAFPPRPIADFLLSVCIKHGTDNFFYFDQVQFLSEIDQFYTDPQSPLRLDCGFVGLALAAFALGSQWTSLEKPEGPASSITPSVDDRDPGRRFHSSLKPLVPDLIERPCMRSIQVPFIMGVYLMPSSAVGSSYVYLGLALRKALAFDLHQNTGDAAVDEREKEARRRLWWSVYSLERITAIKLNRSRAIEIEDINLPLPSPLPDMDRSQVFDNVQQQIAFARLVKILDRVADVGSLEGPAGPDAVKRVEASLKEWKRSLPPEFKLATIHPRDSSYRVVLHLYMNYYYAWIAMGKVSVVTVVRAHLRHHLGRGELPQIDAAIRDLSSSCINAASKILRLFETLTTTGNITRFSFTDFQGCSIATIVTLLAGILGRDSGYETRVNFGLECLRKMAAGNMTAKVGVRFVEALQSIADEAVAKVSRSGSGRGFTQDEQASSTAAEYRRWAQWLAGTDQFAQSGRSTPYRPPTQEDGPIPIEHLPPPTPATGPRNTVSWGEPMDEPAINPGIATPITDPFVRGGGEFTDHLYSADEAFPSLMHGDDQNFLMGLTGLDVLDFSELATPL